MKHIDRYSILLALIILVALSASIWGLGYDLPYIYHPDEPVYITISQDIFKTGDLNPHFFNYPSLFFYINALAYIPYYLVGKLSGVFSSPDGILAPISLIMGVTKSQMPSTVVMGRLITVIFRIGSVWLTYLIGKRLTGKPIIGVLASFMMAVSLPNVSQSRMITPDTIMVFFALASFLGSVYIYQQGKTKYYLIAGICAGLTASTKYNGALIVLPIILAHFLHHGKPAFRNRNLYIALLMCGLGFLVGTPFSVIDFPKFWADLTFESLHYSTGHAGMEGSTLQWYLTYMWRTGNIIYGLGALGLIKGIYSRSREIILLSVFPVAYFLFITGYAVRNDRTFLVLTPFLFLLAASFLDFLHSTSNALASKNWRTLSRVAFVTVYGISIIFASYATITRAIVLTAADSREISRQWIDANLPAGAKFAIESYSPFVDPTRFSVQGFSRMIEHPPEWYRENEFDYLVFSQVMYGRFYNEPDKYSSEITQYNEFFNQFTLEKIFNDGTKEIRIYKVSLSPKTSMLHRHINVYF